MQKMQFFILQPLPHKWKLTHEDAILDKEQNSIAQDLAPSISKIERGN